MKLLGPCNDLLGKDGKITRTGYAVMTFSTLLGICCFLFGRSIYKEISTGQ